MRAVRDPLDDSTRRATPARIQRRTRSRVAVVFLAMLVAAGCGGGATPGAGGSPTPLSAATAGPTGAPPVDTPVDAATVIDVPHEVVASELVSSAGATLAVDGATVFVPPGAVAVDTTVEITRLDAPFQMNPYANDAPDGIPAMPLGPALDFGPAGTAFATPVTVTLSYDPTAIPEGYEQVALAYWTGGRWSILGGEVDPVAHTVSVGQAAFEGEIITAIAIGVAIGTPVYGAIKWWFGKEAVKSDPISTKTAGTWITPKDPAVAAAAATATVGGVPLGDKQALAAYLAKHPDATPPITVTGSDGTPRSASYSTKAGSNWQKPAAYLTAGKLEGDCTDVTSAMVSMFRGLGYPAKAVFGYVVDKDSPHVWGEVAIGGKPYLIDEFGKLQPLEAAVASLKLIRPDPDDPRAFMWDENGQVPYEAAWWDPTVVNGKWAGTFTVTDITVDEAALEDAEEEGCTAALFEEMKGKALPMTLDVTVDATGNGSAVVFLDVSKLGGKDGESISSEPQTLDVGYADGVLTFKLEQSGGVASSMSGRLVAGEGGAPAIRGTMTVAGKGFSAAASWTVTRP